MSTFKSVVIWHVDEQPKEPGEYLALMKDGVGPYTLRLFFGKDNIWRNLDIDLEEEATDKVPKEEILAWADDSGSDLLVYANYCIYGR